MPSPLQPPPSPVRVFLVDDHAVVRVGLKTILADDPRLIVVGEAATGEVCLRRVPELRPAVVLLDLRFSTALQLGNGLRIFSHSPRHQARSCRGTASFTVVGSRSTIIRLCAPRTVDRSTGLACVSRSTASIR